MFLRMYTGSQVGYSRIQLRIYTSLSVFTLDPSKFFELFVTLNGSHEQFFTQFVDMWLIQQTFNLKTIVVFLYYSDPPPHLTQNTKNVKIVKSTYSYISRFNFFMTKKKFEKLKKITFKIKQ